MSYVYVALTVLLTVYGQIVIKWQVLEAGALPADAEGKLRFIGALMTNLWVLSGFAAAVLAVISWMLAMSKLPLSHAYPFTSLSFVLILVILQLWLLTATMNAYLGGDTSVIWPAAGASLACLLLNVGLLVYLRRLDQVRR